MLKRLFKMIAGVINVRTAVIAWLLPSLLMLLAVRADGGEENAGLTHRYRMAHEAADLEALKALVFWEGATERTREIVEGKLEKYLGYSIKEIEIRPLSGDEKFDSSGYIPNLKPAGWLAITFEAPIEDSRLPGQVFVVGEKEGRQLITVAVPGT